MNVQVQFNETKPTYTVVRFNGHITWRGRENGLPNTIYAFVIVQNGSADLVNKVVEEQSSAFARVQAMYAQRDQGKVIDCRINAQDRIMVPFHNISHISVDLVSMSGELSIADETGVERLSDGSEPKVQ